MVCQRYKQFACRVNQPASSWVALSRIFSLSNSFVEICNCIPLYADSFDLTARHLQVSFAGMRQHFRQLPIVVARSILVLSDVRFRICQTPVPVSVRTGVGWKLYYDEYRTYRRYVNCRLDTSRRAKTQRPRAIYMWDMSIM